MRRTARTRQTRLGPWLLEAELTEDGCIALCASWTAAVVRNPGAYVHPFGSSPAEDPVAADTRCPLWIGRQRRFGHGLVRGLIE